MSGGRTRQKARTRQAIVRAAGRLLASGTRPSLDEIADEAGVSRATAYRYFPGLDPLLGEAAVDLLVPQTEDLLGPHSPADPFERVALVDETLDKACREQEIPLRLMLARVLERAASGEDLSAPLRQNRRIPMLEKALAPLGPRLGRDRIERLAQALAMVVGAEGFLALKDVVGLDHEQARRVRHWAIDALIAAALKESYSPG